MEHTSRTIGLPSIPAMFRIEVFFVHSLLCRAVLQRPFWFRPHMRRLTRLRIQAAVEKKDEDACLSPDDAAIRRFDEFRENARPAVCDHLRTTQFI